MVSSLLSLSQKDKSSFIGQFLRLFLPIAMIVIAGGIVLFKSETENALIRIQLGEEAAVQVGTNPIKRILNSITQDLAFLSEQETLGEIISSEKKRPNNLLRRDWEVFSRTKGIYDQIRWLDLCGQERVRINFNNGYPSSVSSDKLQNKGDRYYFFDAVKLNKGEFFISPLDLNIEQGKIEQPIKPMIRIATPVFSYDFKKQGIILLNYFAEKLIDEYEQAMGTASSRAWLLNRDGYWIKGPTPEMEWGFMYGRNEASLAYLYPEAWKKVSSSANGQFEDKHGLWTFTTVYPLVEGKKTSSGTHETYDASRSELEDLGYSWKSVLLLPADEYHASRAEKGIKITLVMTVLLAGLFGGAWRLTSAWTREERAEEELRVINQNLEKTIDERTSKLRHEIKERQKVEDELRVREERFRSITETSSVAMMVTVNEKGNVVTWNPAAEFIFGYSADEALDQPLTIFMPERYRADHETGFERVLTSEELSEVGKKITVHGLKKNGNEFPIELSIGTWKQGATRYFSAVIHDITDQQQAEENLRHMANHDVLTGLPTRRLCMDHISGAMAAARRNKNKAAIMFIDLDGFKAVNDTMGHETGDKLLISVSERLKSCVREIDTVARIGGDEFVVVLADVTDNSNVERIANNLINALAEQFQFDELTATIGASIGIAIYPDDASEPEQLLKQADAAMYLVKNDGKNGFSFVER